MSRALVLAALLHLVACDDDGDPVPPPDGGPVGPDIFQPTPGSTPNWDIQLAGTLDVSAERQMYVVDLWDVTTAATLDYNGTEVTVPAGPLAGKIAELHARDTIVVCQVETGAIQLDDPDAAVFPGHEASPPDRPTAPAAGSVIGWSIDGDANTRYLDLNPAAQAMWQPLIFERYAHAQSLGCDAIAVSWVDQDDPGFTTNPQDVVDLYAELAAEIHRLDLAAGMFVRTQTGAMLTAGNAPLYDFGIVQRCAEFDECDLVRQFELDDKAMFGFDFDTDGTSDRDNDQLVDGITLTDACAREVLPSDWIHKAADAALRPTAAYRMQCP